MNRRLPNSRSLGLLLAALCVLLLLPACGTSEAATTALPATGTPVPASPSATVARTAAPPTLVSSVTAVPSSAASTPSPTASPLPPTATATRIDSARVVRRMLPNGRFCPMLEAPVPEGAALVGRSTVCRLPIVSYRLGEGPTPLVLVGGIHGGYEWNSIKLVEAVRDYLLENPDLIPPSLTVHLIPNANPDGLYAVTGAARSFDPPQDFAETIPGRFNGRQVDLNRNWDCLWQPEAVWGNQAVNPGEAPFSERETQALRDYFMALDPAAVLFWHSAAVGVYASGCPQIDPASQRLADLYGAASGYNVYDDFAGYAVHGDAGSWLAAQDIPAITVELTTHGALDWEQNLAGLQALMQALASDR